MKRPSLPLVLATILFVFYIGSCTGLGILEHL